MVDSADPAHLLQRLRSELSNLQRKLERRASTRSPDEYLVSDLVQYAINSLDLSMLRADTCETDVDPGLLTRMIGMSAWRDEMKQKNPPHAQLSPPLPPDPAPASGNLRDEVVQRRKVRFLDARPAPLQTARDSRCTRFRRR